MSRSTPDRAGTRGKRVLPSSGLAEDVLGRSRSAADQDGGEAADDDQLLRFTDSIVRADEARVKEQVEEHLETWVTFRLGEETFGLPVSAVREILRVSGITRVPRAARAIRGVTNMRGRVLPVIDLRVRLGLPKQAIEVKSRILVISAGTRIFGLLVDEVRQVVRLVSDRIQPPPQDIISGESDYIIGVYHLQEVMVILLDAERLLAID